MAWDQLSINKPHLVYIILGGFTSIFMLVSLFIKEKLYIGEATVATLCGVIFGPHAANLINPLTWGNTDQITLEFSRIVLVVQCFAVGVELPKAYMERHWRSVVFLLVPVMTFGWLITSLFIWWMVPPLTWLESLVCAACVTATDPVLASSVVGKGKFAKRVPKHLRDILSAESGCNDGMAFPFIYLSLYLLRYDLNSKHVVFHWTCYTILYECIFGAFYGVMVGYIGRRAIKLCERKGIIDRESFLVFYFVLALFCAGSGSLLGMDDLLIGFAAGVGFSNDGWFTEKTEESHVSNVIDLLINLAYFVYFGTIIPWDQFNAPDHGLVPWRLVVISLMVIFFRRIPAMLLLKPFIPDVKTWREALFAGHFGPIGVGAIFVAILARAELEHENTEPLAVLPPAGSKDYNLIYLVWPITCFLVMSSILVHGSSIAVFTLGKRINTLTLTLSYTQDNEKGTAWMNRLPRISSQSRSMSKMDSSELEDNEKLNLPPGTLPPIGIPKLQLRRQKEEEYNEKPGSRSSSLRPTRRRKKKDWGGPISQSAIAPARRSEPSLARQESGSDTLFEKSGEPSPEGQQDHLGTGASSPGGTPLEDDEEGRTPRLSRSISPGRHHVDIEAYEEGHEMIIEDTEGNVLKTVDTAGRSAEQKADIIEEVRRRLRKDQSGKYAKHQGEPHAKDEGEELQEEADDALGRPAKKLRGRFGNWKGFGRNKDGEEGESSGRNKEQPPTRKRGPAHAYQFGNTIIVEDEDGEVIKTYTLPGGEKGEGKYGQDQVKEGLRRMSTWVGLAKKGGASNIQMPTGEGVGGDDNAEVKVSEEAIKPGKKPDRDVRLDSYEEQTDDGLRMTISRSEQYGWTGRKKNADDLAGGMIAMRSGRRLSTRDFLRQIQQLDPKSKIAEAEESDAPDDLKREVRKAADAESAATSGAERPKGQRTETVAGVSSLGPQRPAVGRRTQSEQVMSADDSAKPQRPQAQRTATGESIQSVASIEEEDIPRHDVRGAIVRHGKGQTAADVRRQRLATINSREEDEGGEGETAAEKRRRLAALGMGGDQDEDSSESEEEVTPRRQREAVQEPGHMNVGAAAQRRMRVQWGGESGRERAEGEAEGTGQHVGRKAKGMFRNK